MRSLAWHLTFLIATAVACSNSSSSGSTGGSGGVGFSTSGGGASARPSSSAASGGASAGTSASKQGGTSGSGSAGGVSSTASNGSMGGASPESNGGTSLSRSSGGTVAGGGSGGAQGGGTAGTGGRANGGTSTGGPTTGGGEGGGTATSSSSSGGSSTGGTQGGGGSAGTAGGASGIGGTTGNSYHACPTDGTVCRIMPFGDSITDGYNGDTPGGYRVELFRRLHSAGKSITFVGSLSNGPDTVDGASFPRNHEGHSGWTIDPKSGRSGISTLLKNDGGSQSVMLKYTPHIVLLMIGTNDAIDNYDMANAPTRLGKLIDTIFSQLPNVAIIVAQPIPTRGDASKGDDTGTSARIQTYNEAIPAVVKARADAGKHISVVDMYTPFTPKASLIEDQWHPNLQGYVIIGTQWYSALQSMM